MRSAVGGSVRSNETQSISFLLICLVRVLNCDLEQCFPCPGHEKPRARMPGTGNDGKLITQTRTCAGSGSLN
jgi:hypothetical protein